ncbi:hypothetical protein GWI33_004382 [Rhynchophorus ferrugineus]|uniref:Uncharacterized protein n=1 Tax=Rhynchophorus ferrugineus TaxID=354439 RepID=A0A834IUP1_RHYFE|nr:hypothetical protein GWI33_004382 [Rhynchophorus ferrugineus]
MRHQLRAPNKTDLSLCCISNLDILFERFSDKFEIGSPTFDGEIELIDERFDQQSANVIPPARQKNLRLVKKTAIARGPENFASEFELELITDLTDPGAQNSD